MRALQSNMSMRVASQLLPWNIGIRYYEGEGPSVYQVVQVGSELQIRKLYLTGGMYSGSIQPVANVWLT